MLGLPELILIGAIGLVLFGRHLPTMARSLGQTVRNVRREIREFEDDLSPTLR